MQETIQEGFITALNALGTKREPFFVAVDFEQKNYMLYPLSSLPSSILYHLDGQSNASQKSILKIPSFERKQFVDFSSYACAFKRVIEEIKSGNTYLLNLTFPTKITLNGSFEELFYASDASFKCCVEGKFVCFSPERFIQIKGNCISTYPMKGTIDACLLGAQEIILSDEKEMAEHVMVVDLLRNDLSMVARNVRVEKFRYVDKIKAGEKELLHVSSKIIGTLDEKWHEHIGTILSTLLPAGSISGTPKRSSVAIIKALEGYDRGYFSGVFGVFDGKNFDSGVMIRFLEQTDEGIVFKSGGGITLLSTLQKEYDELCDKVYIPLS